MSATERVINDLNVVKTTLCNLQMLITPEMRVRIGQAITSAIDLLKEQAMPVDTKVIGTECGDMEVYCCRACKYQLDPAFHFCPNCGKGLIWE